MSKSLLHLVLLAGLLGYTTGAALAAHHALDHEHHHHQSLNTDCAVCHALTPRAIEPPPAPAVIVSHEPPHRTLTPADRTPAWSLRFTSAQPRAPPV